MKTVRIKRLFHGKASVRDYIVSEAMKLGNALCVTCGDEQMMIPWEKLKEGYVNEQIFTSIHDGKQYRLVDFDWIPDSKQTTLLTEDSGL